MLQNSRKNHKRKKTKHLLKNKKKLLNMKLKSFKNKHDQIKHAFSEHGMDQKLLGKCREAEGKFLEFDN